MRQRASDPPKGAQTDAEVDLLALVDAPRRSLGSAPAVAKLEGFTPAGRPLVRTASSSAAVEARRTVPLDEAVVGAEVLVLYEDEDPRLPIVIGVVDPRPVAVTGAAEIQLDGSRLVLQAEREIVLRCGKASVILRQDGTITLRGEELESRAAGRNKIKGAAVHLN